MNPGREVQIQCVNGLSPATDIFPYHCPDNLTDSQQMERYAGGRSSMSVYWNCT
jgi:hypothetical protein